MNKTDQPGNAAREKQPTGQQSKSIRGAFTYTLLALQERLSHFPDSEHSLVIPTIEKLNWDATRDFWRGTIMEEDGRRPSCSAYAPQRATARILLYMRVHCTQLGLDRRLANRIELGLSDILELAKIAYGPARVAFTTDEQRHISNRLQHLFVNEYEIRSLDEVETKVVRHFLGHRGGQVPAH